AGVVGEDEDLAAVDGAPAGDHAVAADLLLLHPEGGGAVHREGVHLGERAGVEQPLDALARGELALAMLRLLRRAAAMDGVVPALAQQVDLALGDASRGAGGGAAVGGGGSLAQLPRAQLGTVSGSRGRDAGLAGTGHRRPRVAERAPATRRSGGASCSGRGRRAWPRARRGRPAPGPRGRSPAPAARSPPWPRDRR